MLITLFASALIVASPQEARLGAGKASVSDLSLRVVDARAEGPVRVFRVTRDLDSDNDGVPDTYEVRVTCTKGAVASSSIVGASAVAGIAGGAVAARRQHKPMTITKEIDTPKSAQRAGGGITVVDDWTTRAVGKTIKASYDLATMKGARTTGPATAVPVALTDAAPIVCAA